MVNALEVDATELIERAAKLLEEHQPVKPPAWAGFAKTGRHKERSPARDGWWHIRAAAVLRSAYKLGPIGTSKLRTKYGGRKNRGYKPEHFYKGSGAVIRKVLQQLEQAGLLLTVTKGVHKGRKITDKGKSLLDKIAAQMIKEGPRQRSRPIELVAVKAEAAAPGVNPELSPKGERIRKKQ